MRGRQKASGEVYLRKSESKCRGSGVLSMLSVFREQLMRTEWREECRRCSQEGCWGRWRRHTSCHCEDFRLLFWDGKPLDGCCRMVCWEADSTMKISILEDFQGRWLMLAVKNPPANAGDIRDVGFTPGSGRSPGGGHSNPLQYSCLKKPMDRGTWWATIHGVAKNWTRLKQLSMLACS